MEDDERVGIILAIFRWFMPPKISDSPEKQHAWRWRVAWGFWILIPLGLLTLLTAYRVIWVDGFVTKEEVLALDASNKISIERVQSAVSQTNAVVLGERGDIHSIEEHNTSSDLFQLRVQISRDKTDDDKARDCRQFTNSSQYYQDITGKPYGFEPQACDNL